MSLEVRHYKPDKDGNLKLVKTTTHEEIIEKMLKKEEAYGTLEVGEVLGLEKPTMIKNRGACIVCKQPIPFNRNNTRQKTCSRKCGANVRNL